MNFKPNGILSATTARQKAEKNRARIIAHNPNPKVSKEETTSTAEEKETSTLLAQTKSRKNQKFLGFVDPAGNPSAEIFTRARTHAKCGGTIYQITSSLLGTYAECAKCGAWGVNTTVISKRSPRSFFT